LEEGSYATILFKCERLYSFSHSAVVGLYLAVVRDDVSVLQIPVVYMGGYKTSGMSR